MKILLCGYNGQMGSVISSMYYDYISCGYSNIKDIRSYNTYTNLNDIKDDFDIILDFSSNKAFYEIIDFACLKKKPLVIAQTGLTKDMHDYIDLKSKEIKILQSGNFSYGINVIQNLLEKASKLLFDYDVEIVESHHNQKMDAPSGTALMLKDSVLLGNNKINNVIQGRDSFSKKREKNELCVHSIRGGTVFGKHEVLFLGEDEIIKISHEALSKKIFAKGAIIACKYLLEQEEIRRYNMKDVIKND